MKKIILAVCILLCVAAGINADRPENLAFEFGLGNASDMGTGSNTTLVNFGFYYVLDDTIAGGFSFIRIDDANAPLDISFINLSVNTPLENASFRLSMGLGSTGTAGEDTAVIGLGLNYDILTRKSGFFGSLGLFIDWIAALDRQTPANAPFRAEDGGALCIGLRSKLGF
jgi:hypothetical protein